MPSPHHLDVAAGLRAVVLGCGLGAAVAAAPVHAADFDDLGALSPQQFERLAEQIGAATHHRPIAPAEPLGVLGADVSLEVSSTDIDPELFELAGDEPELDYLVVPRLHAQKGLPLRLDAGAMIGVVPETDATLIGVELRYALVEGGVATPSVSLRGSYSRVQGVAELEVDNYALELAVSKGILMLTPYIGAGLVRTDARAPLDPGIDDVSVDQRKLFVGVNLNLGVNLGFEADRTGDYTTYAAKVGLRF